MLLTIACEARDATDLGYLLHKNPESVYQETLPFGEITVFYPEAAPERCTVALLLEVDTVGLVRGSKNRSGGLDQYVNDRPYVASSLLSVALNAAFSTAMNGRSRERAERVTEKMNLRASLSAVACAAGEDLLTRFFSPLGYTVSVESLPLDPLASENETSSVYTLTLAGTQTVQDLLSHLYVLMPVLDNAKHYYIGADEMEKLLAKGSRWLPDHPERDLITRRYLRYRAALIRPTLERLQALAEESPDTPEETEARAVAPEEAVETPMRLNDLRLEAALEAVRAAQPAASRVLDLGCGEGKLLQRLLDERQMTQIVGVDVSSLTLERAVQRLRLDRMHERQRARLQLLQGSVVYRDDRFRGFDVALLIEVIEHLDPPRLTAMESVVFGHARPRRVVLTTPNAEYNVLWPTLPAGRFRHGDHRFEWTRAEFQQWAQRVAEQFGYAVAFQPVGPEDPMYGSPTQMAIFDNKNAR